MHAKEIQYAVARWAGIQRSLLIPNLSHAFFPYWEADLVAVLPSGYMTEYEIKISVADVKREWNKDRWKPPGRRIFANIIRRYYVVMPAARAEQAVPLIPDDVGAGVLTVEYVEIRSNMISRVTELRKPKINTMARKVTDSERIHLGNLMAMRYWNERRRHEGWERF